MLNANEITGDLVVNQGIYQNQILARIFNKGFYIHVLYPQGGTRSQTVHPPVCKDHEVGGENPNLKTKSEAFLSCLLHLCFILSGRRLSDRKEDIYCIE